MKTSTPWTVEWPRGRGAAFALLFTLVLGPLPAMAGPALNAAFLSSGLTEALNDLGSAIDASPPVGAHASGAQSTSFVGLGARHWSVSLSNALDGSETGATVLSGYDGDDRDPALETVVLTGATENHGPRSLKFTVNAAERKAFSVEMGAAVADTALVAGTYVNASADPNADAPLLDVFLGAGSCHSATRSFVIDELVYAGAALAKLTAHFQCGARFAGVLRYEDMNLTGTQAVEISGLVWEDENGDGMQAGDGLFRPDAAQSGINVYLFQDGLRIAQATTNGRGNFFFSVPPGNYQVGLDAPPGMHLTLRDVGDNESRDSDVDTTSGRSDVFDTTAGPPAAITIGLTRPGGQPALPLASTVVQPLRPGDRVSYEEARATEQWLATDTVMPGISMMDGSAARRVLDTERNLQYLSNDARGLRLHRAVMMIPDGINVPPRPRQMVIDFAPPLVLLPPSVEAGPFSSTGKVTVRPLTRGQGRTVTLNYAFSSTVAVAPPVLGSTPGGLVNGETAVGIRPLLFISRSLRFSGKVDNTALSRLTTSSETYAAGVGLIDAGVVATPHSAHLHAARVGFGDDIDGDRRGDLLTVDSEAVMTSGPFGLIADDTRALLSWHPGLGNTPSTDLGRVTALTVLNGDFDADGATELLSYDAESGLLALSHPGDGSELAHPLAFNAAGMQLVTSGEFHRDGHRILMWRDAAGALSQWRLDGSPVPLTYPMKELSGAGLRMPTGWSLSGVGDFNADGASDLLWHENAGQRTVIWLMDGATRLTKVNLPRVDARRRVMAVNDFDGDGRSDVLWYDGAQRQLEVWLMNNGSVLYRNVLGRAPAGAKLIASGDYDGNGNADLLWRKGAQLTLWQMRNGGLYKAGDAGTLEQRYVPLP